MKSWTKLGRVTVPEDRVFGSPQYGTMPTPLLRPESGLIRLFLGVMIDGRGRIGHVDVDADDPTRVVAVSPHPVLDLGEAGMFDEAGVVPSCVVASEDEIRLYYLGYQLHRKVRFTIFTGLAISRDGGETFERARRVPVLDRTDDELFFRSTPFVMAAEDGWRAWYSGGGKWNVVDGKEVPFSEIREASSPDGVAWSPAPRPGIRLAEGSGDEALVRPWVVRRAGSFEMLYSVRRETSYRLERATSPDGSEWSAAPPPAGLEPAGSGWDSRAISYASVVTPAERTYLFYSGNDFGGAGFGVAALDS